MRRRGTWLTALLLGLVACLLPAAAAAQTYTLAPQGKHQFFDNDGNPCNGCKLYTYQAGTSTELRTFSDNAGTQNQNPVELDAYGRASIYLTATSYKWILKTSADVPIWTQDNIGAVPTTNVSLEVTGTAGEALSAGEVVYLSDGSGALTAGRWYKADADNTYSSSGATYVGMVQTAIASTASGSIRIQGRVTGLAGLVAGTQYYASATGGALTSTPPTNARLIGVADATTTILIAPNPGSTFATLTVTGNTTLGDAAGDSITITGAIASDLTFSANKVIRRSTTDGSDTGFFAINGGGGTTGTDNTRGGGATFYGNEHATQGGQARVSLGNVAGSVLFVEGGAGTTIFSIGDAIANLKFPATQSASADKNTLDDYEEDVWTPVIGGSGGTSGQTYTAQNGHYIKTGKQVFVFFYVELSVKGTITTNVQIQGLPFTAENFGSNGAPCVIRWAGLATNWVNVIGVVAPNTTTANIIGAGAAGTANATALVTADIQNNTNFTGSCTYIATN